MEKKTALVVGATGVAGSAVVHHLSKLQEWEVLALSNQPCPTHPVFQQVTYIQADALNTEELISKLEKYCITHVFYTAHIFRAKYDWFPQSDLGLRMMHHLQDAVQKVAPLLRKISEKAFFQAYANAVGLGDQGINLKLFKSVIDAVTQPTHKLQHVAALTGGRYYGSVFMAPGVYDYEVPFREDFPRLDIESWYYQVEDHIAERSGPWTWSVLRPSTIIGYSEKSPFNLATSIASYAAVMKELGRPLIFPGSLDTYETAVDNSCADLLAQQLVWSAITPAARNEVFNAVNGDTAKWSDLWPEFGNYFQMEVQLKDYGVSTDAIIEKNGTLWPEMVNKYALRENAITDLMPKTCLDVFMMIDWDCPYSMDKARKAGFEETKDSKAMYLQLFKKLQTLKVIP
ncbi:NAD-dependent epimerase/dehydratase family protein [Deltaproteobacteria bacterium TL4]